MKEVVASMPMLAAILAAGCSEEGGTGWQQSEAPKRDQAETQKPKTVVVNEGMSKEEEEKLNDRIAALEEEANEAPADQPTEDAENAEPTQEAEDAARAAAED